ncbi:MAG: Stringent starvation protein B [Alphaproteobacteria bacterium]|nr:Stringent starvation protein B [Alphaproteobacteria bacterium]
MADAKSGGGNQGSGNAPALRYDRMVEDALRAVVREALEFAGRHGLPGEHHFYVTFRTDHPGVQMPDHLRARYPQEITIVLQHQFWELKVFADRFQVGLSFGGVPSTLHVPFAALTQFADPSVRFGLQFTPAGLAETGTEPAASAGDAAVQAEPASVIEKAGGIENAGATIAALPTARAPAPAIAAEQRPPTPAARNAARSGAGAPHDAPEPEAEPAADRPAADAAGEADKPAKPTVVQLDAFRRRSSAGNSGGTDGNPGGSSPA